MNNTFSETQPQDGQQVLTCAHCSIAESWVFFAINVADQSAPPMGSEFTRPDGSKGHAYWIVICSDCDKEAHGNPMLMVAGDATWLGNEPVIKVDLQ